MSRDELDRQMPVRPPVVNRKMNPNDHRTDGMNFVFDPYMVASHLNTLIPVGMAMIMVAAVKYARVSVSMPAVNM